MKAAHLSCWNSLQLSHREKKWWQSWVPHPLCFIRVSALSECNHTLKSFDPWLTVIIKTSREEAKQVGEWKWKKRISSAYKLVYKIAIHLGSSTNWGMPVFCSEQAWLQAAALIPKLLAPAITHVVPCHLNSQPHNRGVVSRPLRRPPSLCIPSCEIPCPGALLG